jgi:hypothetical protein
MMEALKLDKELLLSEYSSLRSEIYDTRISPERWLSYLFGYSLIVLGLSFTQGLDASTTTFLSISSIVFIFIWLILVTIRIKKIEKLLETQSELINSFEDYSNNNKFILTTCSADLKTDMDEYYVISIALSFVIFFAYY